MHIHRPLLYGLLGILFSFGKIYAQDIEVVFHDTFLQDTLSADIEFGIDIINVSNAEQIVFMVRTINNLPYPEWTSSLCFGEYCFSPIVDSVATEGNSNPPLAPDDTLIASLHVFPLFNLGTANVQVQIGTFNQPDNRITQNFTATAIATAVEDTEKSPDGFFLTQNYPNPFNPSTNIKYGINESDHVSLKVYDVLGNEVAVLVDEYKPAGQHTVDFTDLRISSGIYIYRLISGDYSKTRKMILEK